MCQSLHQIISSASTPQEDDFVQITEHFESRTEEIQDVITPIEISKLECEPTNQDPEVSDLNDDPCNNQPSESEAEDRLSKQEEKPQTILSIPDGNEYLFELEFWLMWTVLVVVP